MVGSLERADGPIIASWPHWYGPNPYLSLLYDGLATHGILHAPNVPLDPKAFGPGNRLADVLHLHWPYPLWRDGKGTFFRRRKRIRTGLDHLRAIQRSGIRLIWTVHNLEPHDGFRHGEEAAYSALHEMADLRVFHSEAAMVEAQDRYGPKCGKDRLVAYHGNYIGSFPMARGRAESLGRERLPEEPRILLCFGQVRHHKGFDLAIHAMDFLEERDYFLVVCGGVGDRTAHALDRLARTRRNVRVELREIEPQRLSDLISASSVVLLPYRSVTGSGVLLHALTAGRGVVATDLPFFREILEKRPDAGVLVPRDDPRRIAKGIEEYFSFGAGLRETASKKLAGEFDWPKVVEPLASWIFRNPRTVAL